MFFQFGQNAVHQEENYKKHIELVLSYHEERMTSQKDELKFFGSCKGTWCFA